MRHTVFSPHTHSKFRNHYRIERLLGEGSYGNVYEAWATDYEHNGAPRIVAAKCFALDFPSHPDPVSQTKIAKEITVRMASFEKERSILSRLDHPHIVKMYETFEEASYLYIVMEICNGGELYECIANRIREGSNAGLEENVARTLFRQMTHATAYLHGRRIVHRDIKSENFLVLGLPDTPEADIIKLCDFGTAVCLTNQQPRAMERVGTLSYTAPEIYARRGCSTLADLWSLGVVLYVILVGASPFRTTGEEPREDTVARIAGGHYDQLRPTWLSLSECAKDIIRRHLVVDESKRLLHRESLRHRWMEPHLDCSNATVRRYLSPRAQRESDITEYIPFAHVALGMIEKFLQLDSFQQMLLVLCAQLTPDVDLARFSSSLPWYELFFAFDCDEDGRLSPQEFVSGMRALLVNSSTPSNNIAVLEDMAMALDLDGSGAIDWIEWAVIPLSASHPYCSQMEPLFTVFRILDRPSGDKIITAADLATVATANGPNGDSSSLSRDLASNAISRWAGSAGTGMAVAIPAISVMSRARRRSRGHGAQPALSLDEMHFIMLSVCTDGSSSNWLRPSWRSNGLFACCQQDAIHLVKGGIPMTRGMSERSNKANYD